MSFEIKWSRRASLDLADLNAYIAADNPTAADGEVRALILKVDLLGQFPLLGQVYRKTKLEEFRSVISGNYRIVYRIRPDGPFLDIVTIRHGAQDDPDLP